ncbi:unnamed protein product [Mytilus edulis]|uniref:Uncharacterized protein n=1 Tax=Mytilus edulis TaxID=6550 RepID=A0A8S3TM39_MYTED|nr:unnamed protein product [Mytilus edulis]
MSNIKTYPSTTLKQCQTSKLIQVLHSNNVKHQNLSKCYTQTMSNIKPYPSTTLKQCQTSKTYPSTTLKQCQTSKLIQVLHSNNVKHQNLSKYYTQTMSNIKTYPSTTLKQCQTSKTYPSTTLKQCQTSKLIQVLHSNNVKHQNLSKYYTQTMSNIKTFPLSTTLTTMSNIKTDPSTTLKQGQTSNLIQVLHSNNVKHQNLFKFYTQTMSNIKTYPSKHQNTKYYTQTMSNIKTYLSTTLKQCLNIKTYLSTTLKQCQTSKLIQVLHSNNVKHQTQVLHSNNVKHQNLNNVKHQNLSKYYTQTINIKTYLKYYTQTM